jgi:hypothetical protein
MKKTYDSANQSKLRDIMIGYGLSTNLVNATKSLHYSTIIVFNNKKGS